MNILIKLTVPNYIYRFYKDAAQHVADSTPETIMSDALCAYAGLLNEDIAKEQKKVLSEENS